MKVRLMGGLGNQMFQYAFARQVSYYNDDEVILDSSSYCRDLARDSEIFLFNIKAKEMDILQKIFYNFFYYLQIKFKIEQKILKIENKIFLFSDINEADLNRYFVGHWQNTMYFSKIYKLLQKEFTYKGKLNEIQLKLLKDIKEENSVAIHIRRGDYLNTEYNQIYVVQNLQYFMRGIEYLENLISSTKLYVFSDDIKWCKQNFGLSKGICFVSYDYSQSQLIDFELMRQCKHFVISNSTFGWWCAWLSDNKKKNVVAPNKWFYEEDVNTNVKKALIRNNDSNNGKWIVI